MTKLFFSVIALLLVFSSCAPKVTTQILHSYPPFSEDHPVVIYEFEDEAPDSALIIGHIAVTDGGTATRCRYPQVVNYAVKETRKMGGNGLMITTHREPSFKSSCHQITASVLRLEIKDSLEANFELSNEFLNKEIKSTNNSYLNQGKSSVKFNEFGLNLGYGFLVNKTKGLSREERKFEDKLSRGFTWDIYFLRTNSVNAMGWGVIYSGYSSSASFDNQKNNILLTYIAPMYVIAGEIEKWIVKVAGGIGYLRLRNNVSESIYTGKITGSNVGANTNISVGYKIDDNFSLGIEFSAISGSISKLKYKNILPPDPPAVTKDDRMGVSRINCLLGIRYFFNK